jgi:hypothetical protein
MMPALQFACGPNTNGNIRYMAGGTPALHAARMSAVHRRRALLNGACVVLLGGVIIDLAYRLVL